MKWGMRVMKSNRFFFNTGVLRQNLRQHGWIGILYLLGIFFYLPLQLLMNNRSPYDSPIILADLFSDRVGRMQFMLLLIFPAAAGIFTFRYLQAKGSSDFQHSLPLSRERLLVSHLASGLILLVAPILVNACILALVKMMPDQAYDFRWYVLFKWLATMLILTVFMYIFTVFIGVCTGQSILQAVVVFILLVLPAALGELWDFHFRSYLYGYSSNHVNSSMNWSSYSPVVQLLNQTMNFFNRYSALIYTGLSILFGVAAFFLYRLRKTEAATQAIAFTYFNPLFRGGVMLCTMMVAGAYFHQSTDRFGWTWFGYIAGAVVGFIGVEMLLQKSWLIFSRKALIRFGGYTLLCALILYVPVTNISGYVTRVPETAKIEKTGLRLYPERYYVSRHGQFSNLADEEYSNAVRTFHKKLVDIRAKGSMPTSPTPIKTMDTSIEYSLKNGSVVSREYSNIALPLIEKELKPLLENESFKRANYNLDLLDQSIDRITLSGTYTAENRYQENPKSVVITNAQEIREFQDILKREILNMSYEDQVDGLLEWASISILPSGSSEKENYGWKKSFKELDAWLDSKGYATKVKLIPANVTDMEVVLLDRALASDRFSYPSGQAFRIHSSVNTPAAVTDKSKIQSILDNLSVYEAGDAGYIVKFDMTGTEQIIYGFVPEDRLVP
jgi:ABC-2 type transport system permease protein